MSNPAPGFAKYPDHAVNATRSPRHVRVLVGDRVIADTRKAFEVEESRHDQVWYFPPEDVDRSCLIPTETTTYCPFKGHASYYSIDLGGRRLDDAVWTYPTPYDECRLLAGFMAFYADRVTVEVDGRS